ncbi:MAG TPA: endonuclease/exonuclease/phosphatase family protein [Terriglobia bacterium]|nr:endonuclease/exonuclease/phosphatase family protein [Terriglobia bacterium]
MGPAVVVAPESSSSSADCGGRLLVVNWNMHVGNGNITELIGELSRQEESKGFKPPDFVFLLQETFRRGVEVPSPGRSRVPRRIPPPDSGVDIADIARRLGWWMYYVPSMRNGCRVGEEAEDRGNAILSSLPLKALEAVELPFVVQRRVALIATVTDAQNKPKLRVAVAHMDTRAPLLKGWVFAGPSARNRQARSMVAALKKLDDDGLPLVFGADLNSHLGAGEAAVGTVSKIAARRDSGKEPTHKSGLVLDHMFARFPETWHAAECVRLNQTFGSDHYPLVLPIRPASVDAVRASPDSDGAAQYLHHPA